MHDNSSHMIKSMLNDIEHKLARNSNRISDIYFPNNKNFNDSAFNIKEYDTKKYESAYKLDNKVVYSTIGSSTYFSEKPAQENEIRKILEREIEPYLHSIKNELRLFVDKFNKEAGDHKAIMSEISGFKQMVADNKRMILTFQEEFQKKLFDLDENSKNYHMMLENSKSLFEEFHFKLKSNEEKLNQTPQDIKVLSDRIKRFDNSISRVEDNIEKNLSQSSYEMKNLNDRIKKLEISQNELEENIEYKYSHIPSEIKNLSENFKKLEITQNEFEEKSENNYSSIPSEIKSLNDKIKKLENSYVDFEKNMDNNKNHTPQDIKIINDRLKKIENSCYELEETVDKISFHDINIKLKGIDERMLNITDKLNNTQEEIKIDKKQQSEKVKRLLEELKNDINEKTNLIEKEVNKANSSITQQSVNIEKQIEGFNKSFLEKIRMLTEIIKNLKDKNNEYDESYKRTDTILRVLATNLKAMEDNFKELKENKSGNTNATNEIESLQKNIDNVSKNMNDNNTENLKRTKKIVEKLSEFSEENKSVQSKLKDIIIAMKSIDSKFEEKIIKLTHICINNKQEQNNKATDDEFKQELVNRLIVDEKKFIEINENLVILDKNINILSKKIEQIECSFSIQSARNTNQGMCFAYNSCEVHSFRTNFILKGKDDIKLTLEPKNNLKKNIFTEKENISNSSIFSKVNNIDINTNINTERTSEKFKLNNLYLKCDPVNYINYSKNKLKNYLPKYYFSDKKAFVNIVEAIFELNQEEYSHEEANMHTNERYKLEENNSFEMQEEDEKTDSNDDFDSFHKKDEVEKTTSTNRKPAELTQRTEKKDLFLK